MTQSLYLLGGSIFIFGDAEYVDDREYYLRSYFNKQEDKDEARCYVH